MILDFFFFIGVIFLMQKTYPKIIDGLLVITNIIGEQTDKIAKIKPEELAGVLAQQAEFYQNYYQLIALIILFLAAAFFLYTILKGINWKLATKLAEKKLIFPKFLLKFFTINLFWLIPLSIITYLYIQISYLNVVTFGKIINQNIINFLFLILYLLLYYFIITSYSFLTKYKFLGLIKKSFMIGFEKIKKIIPYYLFVLILFAILAFLLKMFIEKNIVIFFIIFLFAFMPFLAYSRVLFVKIINQ